MVLPPQKANPTGGKLPASKAPQLAASIVDTYDGKIHIEWDPSAAVTPLGQLVPEKHLALNSVMKPRSLL